MELTEQQEGWAKSLIGSEMKTNSTGVRITAVTYRRAKSGRGIWFHSSLDLDGPRAYKQFPKHLQGPPVIPDGNIIQSGMEGIMEADTKDPSDLLTKMYLVQEIGVRRNDVVKAYLENDQIAESDPYSATMSVVATALDFAIDHEGNMSDGETDVLYHVIHAIRTHDPLG